MSFTVAFLSVVTVLYVVALVVLLALGPRRMRGQARRLADRCRLGLEGAAATTVPRRLYGRWRGSLVGGAVGFLVPLAVLVTQPDAPLGWSWWGSGGIVGASVGMVVAHAVALRRAARTTTNRTAVLTERRLQDYLSPAQRVVPYVALAMPALAVAVGLAALAGGDTHPARAVTVLASGGCAVLLVGAALVVQRRALHATAPAGSPLDLGWEEALRAMMLRDLFCSAYCLAFTLGAVTAFTATDVLSVPAVLAVAAYLACLLGLLGLLWTALSATGLTGTADRFRRRLGDLPGSGLAAP